MKLYSTDNQPLTPKAKAKVDRLLLNASTLLIDALKTTQDIYTDNAEKWSTNNCVRNNNPVVDISVRYYGEWVEESEENEEWADGRMINYDENLVLKSNDARAIIDLINKTLKSYKNIKVNCSVSEKCYLHFDLGIKNPAES